MKKPIGLTKNEVKVFCMDLKDLPLNADNTVPSFIPVVRDYICKRSSSEGIFRKCGNYSLIQELGVVFSAPSCAVPPSSTVNEVAGFLTQWLSNLPEPLITPSIATTYLTTDSKDPKLAVEILKHLRPLNRRTTAYIFSIIKSVLANESKNRMNFGNLQTCFITALLQNQKCKYSPYSFSLLYNVGFRLLNEPETDFNLEKSNIDELLSMPLPPLITSSPTNSLPKRIPAPLPAPISPVPQSPTFKFTPRSSSTVTTKEHQVDDPILDDDDVKIPKGRSRRSKKGWRYSMPLGGVGMYQEQG